MPVEVFVFALPQPELAAHQAYPLSQAEPVFESFFGHCKALSLLLAWKQPYTH